ncbi:hypothetical protein [Amycolatopsis taiwanensis]|uniref:Uncharacterized protein n=1 Tax=Amycolatopsis taiwanensis TaxID=342230 RepID=A0A9W6R0U9_9PSEU|nr:hypothetical protein [Amycolatopsis taiwanensis]GLY65485.1 hypothetical protein Atai01_21040 [Amycolatopsis taiwanensis]
MSDLTAEVALESERAAALLGELGAGWRKRLNTLRAQIAAGRREIPTLAELDTLIVEDEDRRRARTEAANLETAEEGGVLVQPAGSSARRPMRVRAQRWQGRPRYHIEWTEGA